jgi:hypothetical protein
MQDEANLDFAGTKALTAVRDDRAAAALVQLELLRYALATHLVWCPL